MAQMPKVDHLCETDKTSPWALKVNHWIQIYGDYEGAQGPRTPAQGMGSILATDAATAVSEARFLKATL